MVKSPAGSRISRVSKHDTHYQADLLVVEIRPLVVGVFLERADETVMVFYTDQQVQVSSELVVDPDLPYGGQVGQFTVFLDFSRSGDKVACRGNRVGDAQIRVFVRIGVADPETQVGSCGKKHRSPAFGKIPCLDFDPDGDFQIGKRKRPFEIVFAVDSRDFPTPSIISYPYAEIETPEKPHVEHDGRRGRKVGTGTLVTPASGIVLVDRAEPVEGGCDVDAHMQESFVGGAASATGRRGCFGRGTVCRLVHRSGRLFMTVLALRGRNSGHRRRHVVQIPFSGKDPCRTVYEFRIAALGQKAGAEEQGQDECEGAVHNAIFSIFGQWKREAADGGGLLP